MRANLVVAFDCASSALGLHQPRWGSLWPVVLFRVRGGVRCSERSNNEHAVVLLCAPSSHATVTPQHSATTV